MSGPRCVHVHSGWGQDAVAVPVQATDEILQCLEGISWTRCNTKSKTFQKSIVLGTTCTKALGSDGFDASGFNHQPVPSCLSKSDAAWCNKLWPLLQQEAASLGFSMSTAIVNRDFQPNYEHHHRRYDIDHQWCCSMGGYFGGQLNWREDGFEGGSEAIFRVDPRNVWQKMDGRWPHWVDDYECGTRYSIVLYRVTGLPAPYFYRQSVERG